MVAGLLPSGIARAIPVEVHAGGSIQVVLRQQPEGLRLHGLVLDDGGRPLPQALLRWEAIPVHPDGAVEPPTVQRVVLTDSTGRWTSDAPLLHGTWRIEVRADAPRHRIPLWASSVRVWESPPLLHVLPTPTGGPDDATFTIAARALWPDGTPAVQWPWIVSGACAQDRAEVRTTADGSLVATLGWGDGPGASVCEVTFTEGEAPGRVTEIARVRRAGQVHVSLRLTAEAPMPWDPLTWRAALSAEDSLGPVPGLDLVLWSQGDRIASERSADQPVVVALPGLAGRRGVRVEVTAQAMPGGEVLARAVETAEGVRPGWHRALWILPPALALFAGLPVAAVALARRFKGRVRGRSGDTLGPGLPPPLHGPSTLPPVVSAYSSLPLEAAWWPLRGGEPEDTAYRSGAPLPDVSPDAWRVEAPGHLGTELAGDAPLPPAVQLRRHRDVAIDLLIDLLRALGTLPERGATGAWTQPGLDGWWRDAALRLRRLQRLEPRRESTVFHRFLAIRDRVAWEGEDADVVDRLEAVFLTVERMAFDPAWPGCDADLAWLQTQADAIRLHLHAGRRDA
jgi:hypothetical protein